MTTAGYFVLPILLATLFQPNYLHKVRLFKSTHAARKSYEDIFRALALTAAGIHVYFTYQTFVNESPPHKYLQHNYVWNTHSKEENTWVGQTMGVVGSIAGALSDNPVISQVGWDVLLSTVSLCLWSVVHGVDVLAMLRSSGLTWNLSAPSKMKENSLLRALPKINNGNGISGELLEKAGDAIEELADTIEVSPLPVKARGRGRPRKTSQAISKDHVYAHTTSSSSQAATGASTSSQSLRRSTRSRYDEAASSQLNNEADADGEYQPTAATEKEVDLYDFDEGHEEGMAKETEAGVLSWGLFVLGGLGMVSAGVLGGESSGR